jgi:hypothetical protein
LHVTGFGCAFIKKTTWATDIATFDIHDKDLLSEGLGEPGGFGELEHFASATGEILRRD